MKNTSLVARFISNRIDELGKPQKEIAEEIGFEKPNMITMIKQGRSKLPLGKIGPMANALEICPVQLLKMCFYEYFPETWKAIAPFMESALAKDELHEMDASYVSKSAPFLSALSDESTEHLENFIQSLRPSAAIR